MALKVTGRQYRQGTALAIGTMVDAYLDEEETEKVYKRWKEDWPEPLMFSGANPGITFEMIREVPSTELNKTFGHKFGKKLKRFAAEYIGD